MGGAETCGNAQKGIQQFLRDFVNVSNQASPLRLLSRRTVSRQKSFEKYLIFGQHISEKSRENIFGQNVMLTASVEPVTLNNDEILRYSRHLIMPEVGMDGQLKL